MTAAINAPAKALPTAIPETAPSERRSLTCGFGVFVVDKGLDAIVEIATEDAVLTNEVVICALLDSEAVTVVVVIVAFWTNGEIGIVSVKEPTAEADVLKVMLANPLVNVG